MRGPHRKDITPAMQNSAIMSGQDDWQRPARTEEWVWSQINALNIDSHFFQFVSFPWATLIDLQRRGKIERAQTLEHKALTLGPKRTLIRATICQHIWALDLIPIFKKMGITDLFWPHTTKTESTAEGIRLHPFPLFPVRAYDGLILRENLCTTHEKNILFNFIGAYDPEVYLTPARKWILDIPETKETIIKARQQWHYEHNVYQDQIEGIKLDTNNKAQQSQAEEYDDVLSRSLFTLCPSGSGPNSIRFWEALMFGSIPVLISDSLRLAGAQESWHQAIIQIPETQSAIQSLPAQLQELAKDKKKIDTLQKNITNFRERYILQAVKTLILPLTDMNKIEALSL